MYHIIYMSTNRYCTSCGTKHVVGLTPLKFCSNCGNPFDSTAVASTQPAATPQQKAPIINRVIAKAPTPYAALDAAPEEDFQLPQIDPSDFIIETEKKLTVGDIKTSPGAGSAERGAAASPMLTPEQVKANMEQIFAKEREFVTTNKNQV